jgi:periplasmic protein TonB
MVNPTKFRFLFAYVILILAAGCSSSKPDVPAIVADTSYHEVPMPEDLISEEFPRPDTWAKYPGGQQVLTRTIQMRTGIPEKARREGYGGRAIITYIVDENGRAGQVEALMSPHESITEMYRNLIDSLERWQPAVLNGEPVPQKYMILTTFRDGNAEDG